MPQSRLARTCTFALFCLLLLPLGCSAVVTDTEAPGTYKAETDWGVSTLVLAKDHTFQQTVRLKNGQARELHGWWKIDKNTGAQVYTTYCASCHGVAGQAGKSKAGSITEPAFLALVSDQALRTIVIAGRPDIGQPDWRNDVTGHPMSDQEVTDVVGWLSSQRPGAQQKKGGGGAR